MTLWPLVLVLALSACSPVPTVQTTYDPQTLRFSGERALEIETEFVQRFPLRASGMPNNQLAAEWLRQEFTRLGWQCRLDQWEMVNYNRSVPLRNVVCELPGESPRQLLVVAHHDQSPDTVQGADNDGSGIAILLHLAGIFQAEAPLPYTLVFVTTDAEEYGMVGTRQYIQTHPDTRQIIAGISLDNLGKQWSNGMNMDPRGQFRGYGPLWLLLTAREAARAAGDLWIPVMRSPLDQVLDQAVPISFMDEGPMVAAGVPAFGFATRYAPGTSELEWNSYHTPGDTLEIQSTAVLSQSGRIAEALLRQLLVMETFPQESGPYLYFDDRQQVLRGWPLWLIFIALVVLFFVGSLLVGGRLSYDKLRAWRAVVPHFLSLWLPLLASIALLYGFVAVGLMDTYHLYPATAKDEPLFQPKWPAVILYLLGLTALLILGRRLAGRFMTGSAAPSPGQTKSFALLVIGLAGGYILLTNPFSLLFMAPLVGWFLIGGRRGVGWALDLGLFMLGGLVVYQLLYLFGFVILRNNFAVLWYVMMMFSIGMISFPAAVAITAIIAAGLSTVVHLPRRGTRTGAGGLDRSPVVGS
ncbi:MAG: M28 family peptidase [Deinococcus sp.]|nr:M28 family peptidase [Deinococcus sp.]